MLIGFTVAYGRCSSPRRTDAGAWSAIPSVCSADHAKIPGPASLLWLLSRSFPVRRSDPDSIAEAQYEPLLFGATRFYSPQDIREVDQTESAWTNPGGKSSRMLKREQRSVEAGRFADYSRAEISTTLGNKIGRSDNATVTICKTEILASHR